MTLTKKIDAIRTDSLLTEQERVWKALRLIAQHVDDGDDADFVSALFGD